tara:strand:- start:320 stop:481 length:162 start_codon:yes stop_codon:yes gene_type:complete
MANLQYRGAEVVQKEAMKSTHIASYRGATYNTEDIEVTPKAQSGQYRGASWVA